MRGGVSTGATGGRSLHWDNPRIIASNTRPVFVATVYGNNGTGHLGAYVAGNDPEALHWFENDISPRVMWGLIPENLKTYSVIGIHANTNESGSGGTNKMDKAGTRRFYDEQLTICDEIQAPAMIVIMAARGSSGSSYYSFNGIDPTVEEDKKWIKEMVAKHPSLKGFITSEHYWTYYNQGGDDAHHGKWLRAAVALDKTLLIHDKVFDSSNYFSDTQFKSYALQHGDDHLILATKYTSAGEQHEAHSYAQGAWLTGVSHAYGGLIDTWSWAERGYGEPMTNSKDSGTGRYVSNGVTQYPGGVLASFMMQMYLNGATVFNFEAPWVICASEGKASTHMVDVIAPFFDWMVKNPAPTEAEMRSMTKYYFTGSKVNPTNIYPPTFDPGNNDATYKTGRYGLVPFVSQNLFNGVEGTKAQLKKLGGFNEAMGDLVSDSGQKFGQNWDNPSDGYYEDPSLPKTKGGEGEPFAAIRSIGGSDTYYFYNTHIGGKSMTDESHIQYARIPIGTEIECDIENDICSANKFMEVGLTPHTAVIVKREANDSLRIWMCNARVDTSSCPGFGDNAPATGTQWTNGRVGMDYWIAQNLCIGGSHTDQNKARWERDTKFYFEGSLTSVECRRVDGQPNSTVSVSDKTVTARSNGWLEFVVTVK